MFKLSPAQWTLAQLFDGTRSYAEIAELYTEKTGEYYDQQTVTEFGADLETAGFWYQTAQEKNVLLLLQSKEERRKNLKAKNRFSDLSVIIFPAFNPDRFLTWLYSKTTFIYTKWFTILTVIGFAFTLGLTISHWPEIGRDTAQFYNFSDKTFADVVDPLRAGDFRGGSPRIRARACVQALRRAGAGDGLRTDFFDAGVLYGYNRRRGNGNALRPADYCAGGNLV